MRETFVVRILYGQNSTWQGTVDWVRQNGATENRAFRSALELIRLMDSAISGDCARAEDPERRDSRQKCR